MERRTSVIAIVIAAVTAILAGGCTGSSLQEGSAAAILSEITRQSAVVVPYVASSGPQATIASWPRSSGGYPATRTAAAQPWPAPSSLPEKSATLLPTPTLRPTLTPSTTPSPTSSATPSDTPTPTPSVTPTVTPVPVTVNGIPLEEIVVMPEVVREQVRETAALGRELGRDPGAFSKIGDSVTLTPHYLTRFDKGPYELAEYAFLQEAIDQYAGSFERYGVATRVGLHAWSLHDPLWANKDFCLPNENMVDCEIRLHNPSVLLIRLGSNDAGAEKAFNDNMRALVEKALDQGIIPILGTKADRFEGPDDRNNRIIREIAAAYNLPLWDFDHVADTIPGRGLGSDQVHMTMADSNDYGDPHSFERGYPVSDLTALMALYAVYQETLIAGDA